MFFLNVDKENICTVFLSLEQEINFEVESKQIQYISACSEPLLNSNPKVPSLTLNILITVPLSDAVASKEPSLFKDSAAIGVS